MSSRTVRTACLAAAAAASVFAVPAASNAAILAQWTFETTTASITGTAASGPAVAPETGTGSFAAVHVSASSAWSSPSGPASAHTYSGNGWGTSGDTTGNYYQFSTSSTGNEDLTVSFDATGSNTGPKNFKFAYSTDGSSFTDFSTYAVANAAWSASPTYVQPSNTHFSFDLSAITDLNDQANVYFRLIQVDSTAISGTLGASGTSRVDNVTVSATAVPEPATLGLVTGAGLLLAGRRRRA